MIGTSTETQGMGITMILARGCQGLFLSRAVKGLLRDAPFQPHRGQMLPTLGVIGQKTPAGKDSPKTQPSCRAGTLQALGIVP